MVRRETLAGSLIFLSLLLLSIAACGGAEELTPDRVLDKAYAATKDVTSYRFIISASVVTEKMEELGQTTLEGEYLAPDRVRIRYTEGGELREGVSIGHTSYWRESELSPWQALQLPPDVPLPATAIADMVNPQSSLGFMNFPSERLLRLPDDVIDGVDCWRYRTTVDRAEDLIRQMEKETDPAREQTLQETIDLIRATELTEEREIWIGKENYVVKQLRSAVSQKAAVFIDDVGFPGLTVSIPAGTRFTITATWKLSNFNEPVEIEAPL